MNKSTAAITLNKPYYDSFDEIETDLGKVETLLNVIIDDYFERSGEAIQKDEYFAFRCKNDYAEIQSLLFILLDYFWSIKKEVEAFLDANDI